ncbi:hypothetical protein G7075_01735 [Phycicoccus sp. HDW14]|uniref:hypothetical protein n=1 Tax=Phycicoccus sp. HDW14 TaxID=2714941 RepID=UPI00140A4875|nr:hypothetical protein [Phycicoccus sp. HDW14]QIM20164.1 hypothetical protein G7075_01735 [Phycicoccus sp. HDW14]
MPRTPRGAVTLAEERPRTRRRRWVAAGVTLLVLGVLVAGGWVGIQRLVHAVSGEQCRVTAAGAGWDWGPDQASNAAAITAIAVQRDLPPRAASIAIATAMQESKVRNVRFGDRDSLGLFQQRPSQGWGSAEQILDPEYSTNKFYDALVKVKGYTSMDIAKAAQAVQRSAAGEAYAQHEAQARATASVLSGQTHAGIGCALRDPESPGSAEAVAALLAKDFGIKGTVEGSTVRVRAGSQDLAWAVGSWAVARATDTGVVRVSTNGREWTRSMEDAALAWSTGGSTDEREVVIHLA